jgi:DNA-binding NarL/FixJ family response regulator
MSLKVLIVEDEPLISEDLAIMLNKEGYQVVGQAFDGTTALDLLHLRQPDIALLDIALNHSITGLDIARVIHEKYHIPFIFITSYSDKQTLDQAKNLLPEGYIVKPFKKRDIFATLEIVAHRINVKKQQTKYLTLSELNKNLSDPLTPKEYEIILDIVQGYSNDQLCEKHFISLNTVKTHLKRIFSKMDISNRSQLAGLLFRKNP